MRTIKAAERPIYSSSYLFFDRRLVLTASRPGLLKRVAQYLFAIPGRLWRAICFKVILITILSMLCGVFIGAVWIVYETDGYEEYKEYDDKLEWLLYEARI